MRSYTKLLNNNKLLQAKQQSAVNIYQDIIKTLIMKLPFYDKNVTCKTYHRISALRLSELYPTECQQHMINVYGYVIPSLAALVIPVNIPIIVVLNTETMLTEILAPSLSLLASTRLSSLGASPPGQLSLSSMEEQCSTSLSLQIPLRAL